MARLEVLEENTGSVTSDLFVVGEGQMQRCVKWSREELRKHREDDTTEGLHVTGSAPVKLPVANVSAERIAAPDLPIDRNDIGVPGEHDAPGPRAVDSRDGDKQVRFGALGIQNDERAEGVRGHFRPNCFDKCEVRSTTCGVERNQFLNPVEGGR